MDSDGNVDAARITNGDEVPLDLRYVYKQITASGERVQIRPPPLTEAGKYRTGTLVPFISASGSLLFCALLLKGGPTFNKNERPGIEETHPDLMVFANKSAYMDNAVWTLCVDRFLRETRLIRRRAGAVFGVKHQNNKIILYADNFSAHSTDSQVRRMRRDGVLERRLIPNATHIQQPVDQHIGLFLKRDIKRRSWSFNESLLDEVDAGSRCSKTQKVGRAAMRLKLCEWTQAACIALREKQEMVRRSFVNLGVFLATDGSQDVDASTIVSYL